MSNNFKKQAAQKRAAVPQVDLETTKQVAPIQTPVMTPEPPKIEQVEKPALLTPSTDTVPADRPKLAQVDTSETPTNRGFSMYPSRHRQVAKDLAYIEDRKPWEIIDDALEEYVVKHYGKDYKRK